MIGSYDTFFKIYSEENDRLWELYRKGLMPKKILKGERFELSFQRNGTPVKFGGDEVNEAYLAEMVNQTRLIDGAHEVFGLPPWAVSVSHHYKWLQGGSIRENSKVGAG